MRIRSFGEKTFKKKGKSISGLDHTKVTATARWSDLSIKQHLLTIINLWTVLNNSHYWQIYKEKWKNQYVVGCLITFSQWILNSGIVKRWCTNNLVQKEKGQGDCMNCWLETLYKLSQPCILVGETYGHSQLLGTLCISLI